MITDKQQDARALERICNEIDVNFFVEAAAGSGKTYSLVSRMLAMVEAGHRVEEICAITFTKAAAREFYSRFQQALTERLSKPQYAAHSENYRRALRDIDLCFMGTIDSFANMLLHEHPVEARIPADCNVCAGSEATAALMREYTRLCAGEYPKLTDQFLRFCNVQEHPQEVFLSCIDAFLQRREAAFVCPAPAAGSVNARYATWKAQLVDALTVLRDDNSKCGTTGDVTKIVKKLPRLIGVLRDNWDEHVGEVVWAIEQLDRGEEHQASSLRLAHDKTKILSPDDAGIKMPGLFVAHTGGKAKKLDYWVISLRKTPAYLELKRKQYAETVSFLAAAADAFTDEMRRGGTVIFHEALLCLRNMLRDDAAAGGTLIRHIAGRHKYYLIDEYQDTNPLQSEIIFYLAAAEPKADWTACVPRPGSLFIVGDPKQSIYRFSGADISAYMRVRSLFEGGAGEVLYLARNRRSTRLLREWFNSKFPALLREEPDVQSGFQCIPIDDGETDTESTGFYTYTTPNGQSLKDDPAQVAQIVQQIAGNPAYRLKDGKAPEYRDFMIITYTKTRTAAIARALQAAGIPTRTEGEITMRDCSALTAAVDLMKGVSAPSDALAVFAALRSAGFGLAQERLTAYCRDGGYLSIFGKPEDRPKNYADVTAALDRLRKYWYAGRAMSSAALMQYLGDETKLFARTGTDAMEYYFYALEKLRAAEAAGEVFGHADAVALLEGLLEKKAAERCVSLDADPNRVLIANLHKVKGLERPIVILANPKRKSRPISLRTVRSGNRCTCNIFRVANENIVYAATEDYPDEKQAEENCLTAEDNRLLYVAATRARNILIVGISVDKKTGERAGQNPWAPLLPETNTEAAFKPAKADTDAQEAGQTDDQKDRQTDNSADSAAEEKVSGDTLYQLAETNSVLDVKKAAKKSYETIRPSKVKQHRRQNEPEDPAQEQAEGADADPDVIRAKALAASDPEGLEAFEAEAQRKSDPDANAALRGTLVHRLMECLVSARGRLHQPEQLIRAILREEHADEAIYAQTLHDVLNTMTSGGYPQQSKVPQDLLAELRDAEQIFCELPFCNADDNGNLLHGIMDLVYCKNGTWHIVDYKTNAKAEGLETDYAAQLRNYQNALRNLAGITAEPAIYHISV